jgi:uncharacterized membrane protein
VEIVLALCAAAAYGASDFTGGVLSKKTAVLVVVLLSQMISLVLLLVVAPFWKGDVSSVAFGWGAAAGVAGAAGAALLYRGLAVGRMSVVAPISGVLAAAIPVVFGFGLGERPAALSLAGVGLGLIAVITVSRAPDAPDPSAVPAGASRGRQRGILDGVGAGIGFGLFFVALERSPEESGLWPLVGTRFSMIAVVGSLALVGRVAIALRSGSLPSFAGLGVINVLADLLYLLATRRGLLSLVAVITSMYPAATVALGRWFLNERMTGQQLFGLGVAAASIALIASG